MASNPAFELFETLCAELAARQVQVITEDDLDLGLVSDLSKYFDDTNTATSFKKALEAIEVHFTERGARVPYQCRFESREFAALDGEFLEFIAFARAHRSTGGKPAKEFEVRTMDRLRGRLAGDLRCVGTPRTTHRRKREYLRYLKKLGFDDNCLLPKDKDGGFDILWSVPLGAAPLRPLVSVQCKNSYFDEADANHSVNRARSTLARHSHLRVDHLKLVVFNDYIDREEYMGRAVGWSFVPLGLTDLASMSANHLIEVL